MKKQKILGKTCTGRIELGDGTTILAGVNGIGTAATDIRFWSGSTFANRTSAPFRVQQDGKVYATSGAIGGWNLAIDAIYSGTKSTANGFSTSGITLGSDGSIHAPRFYVNADGSVGIRSGTATGKRVVINSSDNRIELFNASNQRVAMIDDDINSDGAGIFLGIASGSGGPYSCATVNGVSIGYNQTAKLRLNWDNANDRSMILGYGTRNTLGLYGTEVGNTRVIFRGLPESIVGVEPGELYRDSSGYIRQRTQF